MAWRIFEIISDFFSDKKKSAPSSKASRSSHDQTEEALRSADRFLEDYRRRTEERQARNPSPASEKTYSAPSPLSDARQQAAYRSATGRIDRIGPDPEIKKEQRQQPPKAHEEFRAARIIVKPEGSPVLHPEAIFFDAAGEKYTIPYTDLKNQTKYIQAKQRELFTPDGKMRLQARLGRGIPHFYHPSDDRNPSNRVIDRQASDERENSFQDHEDRIIDILNAIDRRDAQRVITFDFARDTQNPRFILANINGYTWEANTTQMELSGAIVRPDITGFLPRQPVTENHPRVFIEVVRTHFPSENTWNAYLKESMNEKQPLVVCFDFMANYHLSPIKQRFDEPCYEYDLRTMYYIWQGSLWKNTNRLTVDDVDYTSQKFKALMDRDSYRPKPNDRSPDGNGLASGPA